MELYYFLQKENSELHGLGLKNVKRIVEEYSGYMQQEDKKEYI